MTQENLSNQDCPVADVLDSVTLLACPSHPQKTKSKNKGVIANLPVIIAEPKIQINVESTIRLENLALDIKRIKKNIFFTQCELLTTDDKKSGKLFLSGFVRKNIEYSTVSTVRNGAVSGDIRHTTVRIPFSCFAKVDFIEEPEFDTNENEIKVEIFDPDVMGNDPEEYNSTQAERFNQKVFCELVEAKFREKDLIENLRPFNSQNPSVRVFDTFIEKMIIDVVIRVKQNQAVEIPRVCKSEGGGGRDGDGKGDGKDGRRGDDKDDDKDGRRDCYRDDYRDGRKGDRDEKCERHDCYERDDRDRRYDRDERDCRGRKENRDCCRCNRNNVAGGWTCDRDSFR